MRRTSLITLALLLFWTFVTAGQERSPYKTYKNVRFNYSISYPSNILTPQGESENRDGQKFVSKNGRTEMLVYGSNNALDQTLRQAYEEATTNSATQSNRLITYKVIKPDWFVVSGIENGRVFYQKTFLRSGTFKTFRIEYDESEKGNFDPITTKIGASFKG